MKKWLMTLMLVGISSGVFAADAWMTDFDAARQKAKAESKHILVNFSGSDWCPLCIRLDKEVFSQKEFKDYAKDNLILVKVDFPEDQSKMTDEQKKANEKLAKEFRVSGFPTVFVLSPDGKSIAKTGYQFGGAEAYVKHIQRIIANAKK